MNRPRIPIEERFWAKVDQSGDCWLWTASLNTSGYGQLGTGGRFGGMSLAHRVSYEIAYGPIESGLVIDHICRTPKCVRPQHLRAVTQKQNMENLASKGRADNISSGIRGVTWYKADSKWGANVGHRGRNYYLGQFVSLEDAKAAVIAKRLELHTHNDLDRIAA